MLATWGPAIGSAAATDSVPTLLGLADFQVYDDRVIQVGVTINGYPATMILRLQNIASIIGFNSVAPLGLTARTLAYGKTTTT